MASMNASTAHLALSTTPVLILLSYFLYLAHKRPNLARYNLEDDVDDGQIVAAYADPLIAMIEMFYVFLSAVVFWVWMFVYLLVFIPKRRKLVQTYLDKNVKSILGDVSFEKYYSSRFKRLFDSILRSEYAYVTYTLEKDMCIEEEFVDKNFFESWKFGGQIDETNDEEDRPYINADESQNITGAVVQRKIRTFFPFDREKVTILVHKNKPRSGIPRLDVEKDVSLQVGRDSIKALKQVSFLWTIFSILGSIYIVKRMELVDDAYENDELAWTVFAVVVIVIIPATSFGLNWLHLFFYRRFLFDQGIVRPILAGNTSDGNYVQIS